MRTKSKFTDLLSQKGVADEDEQDSYVTTLISAVSATEVKYQWLALVVWVCIIKGFRQRKCDKTVIMSSPHLLLPVADTCISLFRVSYIARLVYSGKC